jgi:hypothetical protein
MKFMKFDSPQFFSWPERRVALTAVYERALERIRIMVGAGYDAVYGTPSITSAATACVRRCT